MTDRRCFVIPANAALGGTLSGGAWAAEQPLDHLLLPTIYQDVARCVSAVPADRQFDIVLPRRTSVGAIAIAGHTLAKTRRVRVSWWADAAGSLPTGPAPAWTPLYGRVSRTADLSIDHPEWLTGRPTDAELDRYTRTWLAIPERRVRARRVRFEFDGETPFDLGHLFLGELFRSGWPMAFGRELKAVSRSVVDTTPGGRRIADRRRPLRKMRVTFEDLTKDEAARWMDLSIDRDTIEPLLFVPDPGDPRHWWREVFLATLTELVGWEEKDDGYYRVVVDIEELLA